MKVQLLGTAAAEAFPGIFCNCESCQKARKLGGKNIRTRTSAVIDDTIKIDFPPDTYHHVLTHNLDLSQIEHLLFTHTHHDHFHPYEIGMRSPVYAHKVSYPLKIYGNDAVLLKCQEAIPHEKEHYEYYLIRPFKSYQIGTAVVTPLLADHNPIETCLIYYIEKDGKAILYGHDTGWFPKETWDFLREKKIDLAVLDCTCGLLPIRQNHMNIEAVKEIKKIFLENKIMNEQGQVIATHFSHNIGLMHEDLERIFQNSGIIVAYDGMVIEL